MAALDARRLLPLFGAILDPIRKVLGSVEVIFCKKQNKIMKKCQTLKAHISVTQLFFQNPCATLTSYDGKTYKKRKKDLAMKSTDVDRFAIQPKMRLVTNDHFSKSNI